MPPDTSEDQTDPMPDPNPAALDFLLTRRSRPAKTLRGPWPDRAALMPILTAGTRCPDHGKLEPWRLIVLNDVALNRLAGLVSELATERGLDETATEKAVAQFRDSGCAIAVVSTPIASEKVPAIEQTYSAGAVCLSLLNAALAAGWGANWLTGWAAHDREFVARGLGLAEHESIAGFIHVGSEGATPPERPRPDLEAKVSWIDA